LRSRPLSLSRAQPRAIIFSADLLPCPRSLVGGYAADFTEDSLLKKYRPDIYDLPTTNGDHCTGDGQKLAMDIGGAAIDLEKVQGGFPLVVR
jgi:hypothetical protein